MDATLVLQEISMGVCAFLLREDLFEATTGEYGVGSRRTGADVCRTALRHLDAITFTLRFLHVIYTIGG